MNVIEWQLIYMKHIFFISNPYALTELKGLFPNKNIGLIVGEGATNCIRPETILDSID